MTDGERPSCGYRADSYGDPRMPVSLAELADDGPDRYREAAAYRVGVPRRVEHPHRGGRHQGVVYACEAHLNAAKAHWRTRERVKPDDSARAERLDRRPVD